MCNTICGKFGSNLYRARVNSSLFKVRIYCYYHITGVLTLVILFFNCCSSYFYFLFAYQMSWVSEIKDTEHIWASSCICRLSGNLCLCLPYSLFRTFQGKVIWWNFIKLGSMETKIMDSVLQVCRICEVGKEGKKKWFLEKKCLAI